jgi:gliding motility-associated-like protein
MRNSGHWLSFFLIVCMSVNMSIAQITPVTNKAKNITPNPAGFIQEKGQFRVFDDLKFHWKGNHMFVYLLSDRLVFITQEVTYKPNAASMEAETRGDANLAKKLSAVTTARRFDLLFENCNRNAKVSGEEKQNISVDYYLGHCPNGILDAGSFRKVRYSNLYPNIDLVLINEGKGFTYEFEVREGGNPSDIQLRWDGVENAAITSQGGMQFTSGSFTIHDEAPTSYSNGRMVKTTYQMRGKSFGFETGSYDKHSLLVIDPALYWASSLQYNGYGSWGALVTATTGDFYVVDWEWNPGGAEVSSYLSSAGTSYLASSDASNEDIIISKFNKLGQLTWACRYGGTGDDDVNGAVCLDDNNNLYIAGTTGKEFSSPSGDFPLQVWTGAFNQAWNGTLSTGVRGYLLKFLPNNTRQWSTYLDNGTNMEVFDIACGLNNDIYIAGKSGGSLNCAVSIPSGSGYAGAYTSVGASHNFVYRFNSSGAITWSSWLPGATNSTGRVSDIAIDKTTGDLYMAGDEIWGATYNFANALITATLTYMGQSDLFYMKFNSSNQPVPAYGKYLGGAGFDKINIGAANGDIELDASSNLYMCGHTYSANFPVVNPGSCTYYDGTIDDGTGITANVANNQDGYLFKVNTSGTISYCTFFGGANYTSMKQLKKDSHSNLWICGEQTAAGLAQVTHADYYNQAIAGASNNIMFAQLRNDDRMDWLSYFGFSGGYAGYNGFDIWEPTTDSCYLFVTGNFSNFVNTGGGYQFTAAGSCSAAAEFRHKLSTTAPFTLSGTTALCVGNSTTWTSTSPGGTWSSGSPSIASVNPTTGQVTALAEGSSVITYSLTSAGCTDIATMTVNVTANASIASVTGSSPLCIGDNATYTANTVVLGGGTGAWSSSNNAIASVNSSGQVTANSAGNCNITYTISGGCGGTITAQQSITVSPTLAAGVSISASPSGAICPGTSVTFTASPVNPGASPTYQWYVNGAPAGSNSATFNSNTLAAGDQISCTMNSSASCITGNPASSGTITMSVNTNSTAATSVNATANPICSGNSSTLSVNGGSLGTGANWQWFSGSCNGTPAGSGNSITVSPTGNTTYYVLASGTCNTTACVSLPVTVNAAADATITAVSQQCISGSPINLSAVDAGGTWTGTGITNAAAGTFDPATAGLGTHQIIYTISGSCGDADTIQITVVNVIDASIDPVGVICNTQPAFNLTAANSGGTWSGTGITNTSAGTFNPAIAGNGTHVIVYQISGTCGSIDSISVTVVSTVDASINSVTPLCNNGNSITLTAANGGGTWSGNGITNASTGSFDPVVAGSGISTVVYTISGSCGDSDSIQITINPAPQSSASGVKESCIGANDGTATVSMLSGTAPYTYLWNNSATTAALGNLNPGIYMVTVTDGNNCSTRDTAVVAAGTEACDVVTPVIYIPNIFTPNEDGNNDVLYVRGEGISSFTLMIYNRWGQKVFETSDLNQGWNGEFHGKKVDQGVFVYTLNVVFIDGTEKKGKGNITVTR